MKPGLTTICFLTCMAGTAQVSLPPAIPAADQTSQRLPAQVKAMCGTAGVTGRRAVR